jgi:DNA-binding HxlR family transcriptional regulator
MINLEELNKTINYLNELKEREIKKQIKELKEVIENELKKELEHTLRDFESQALVNFIETYKKNVCFDYNYTELIETIKSVLYVDVWEVD